MKKKVIIIVCYYGRLPAWLDLWLLSCSYNPRFHFMIVTDQRLTTELPANVRLLQMSIEQLRQKFTHVLGFEAALLDGYKICDYKPLYGLAFQDELLGYDFWGHGDIDLIWGDLSKFIDEKLYERYDRIGNYGHFILYRNTEEVNKRFLAPGSLFPFDKVFKDRFHYGFDETMGMNRIYERNCIPYYRELCIADANWLLSRISVCPKKSGAEVYFWRGGRVFRAYKYKEDSCRLSEFAYLHFQKKKPVYHPGENYENGFFIKANEFKPLYTFPLSLQDIERENEFCSWFSDGFDLLHAQINRAADLLFVKEMPQKKIILKKGFHHFMDNVIKKVFGS